MDKKYIFIILTTVVITVLLAIGVVYLIRYPHRTTECQDTEWSEWSGCVNGKQSRSKCDITQTRDCIDEEEPVDPVEPDWNEWSDCIEGERMRTDKNSDQIQVEACTDCDPQNWSDWDECIDGLQTRHAIFENENCQQVVESQACKPVYQEMPIPAFTADFSAIGSFMNTLYPEGIAFSVEVDNVWLTHVGLPEYAFFQNGNLVQSRIVSIGMGRYDRVFNDVLNYGKIYVGNDTPYENILISINDTLENGVYYKKLDTPLKLDRGWTTANGELVGVKYAVRSRAEGYAAKMFGNQYDKDMNIIATNPINKYDIIKVHNLRDNQYSGTSLPYFQILSGPLFKFQQLV